MTQQPVANSCSVCGINLAVCDEICPECSEAFATAGDGDRSLSAPLLDTNRYLVPMFPWEETRSQPRLITVHPVWLSLALVLIALVILLALLRTPLPSCWEISS